MNSDESIDIFDTLMTQISVSDVNSNNSYDGGMYNENYKNFG